MHLEQVTERDPMPSLPVRQAFCPQSKEARTLHSAHSGRGNRLDKPRRTFNATGVDGWPL